MEYLVGEHIKIDTKTLKELIGCRIEYLRECDIDKSGRGFFFPRTGTISEIYRKHIVIENGDFISFSSLREIIKIGENNTIAVYDYDFKNIEDFIVGSYTISEHFNFVIYSNHAPNKDNKIFINKKIYVVESVTDVTSSDEFEEGLSFSKVILSLC